MKRLIALFLTLILCVTMCACGGSEPPEPTPTPTPVPTPVPTPSPEELAAKYDADMAAAIGSDDRAPLTAGLAVTYWLDENEVGTYNTKLLADEWIAEKPAEAKYVVRRTEGARTVGMYLGTIGGNAYQRYVRIEILNSVTDDVLVENYFYGGDPPATIKQGDSHYGSYPDEAEIADWILTSLGDLSATQKDAALKTAHNLLGWTEYSKADLQNELTEVHGFSPEEAAYAAENCGADWNKQALGRAKDFLAEMNFSRNRLFYQLTKFDLYTEEEANYALDSCGANWNKQAVETAKAYLANKVLSRNELFKLLTDDRKFNEDEANYALDNCGVNWTQISSKIAEQALADMEARGKYSRASFLDFLVTEKMYSKDEANTLIDSVNIDWNAQAVKAANWMVSEEYRFGYSEGSLVYWLSETVENYGYGFTKEQAQYALEHITADWNRQAEFAAASWVELWDESIYGELNEENLLWTLTDIDQFTEEQARHGMSTVTIP